MNTTTHFKKLPQHLKPREKALTLGVDQLSDAELLAIMIRFGSKKHDVLQVANNVLKTYKELSSIKHVTINDLTKIDGIGKTKAIELKSLFEFARRFKFNKNIKITNISDAAKYAYAFIENWSQESFVVLVVNGQKNVAFCKRIYTSHAGGIDIEPKDIIKTVLKTDNVNFYCFHNHPSGNPNPSKEDIYLNERLTYISQFIGVNLIANIVLTEDENYKKID